MSPSRLTCARDCPRSRSSGSQTWPCARRVSASGRRSATRDTSSRRAASRPTSRPATCPRRVAGVRLDLAIACALLAASDQLPREHLDSVALLGELGLDGDVRPSHGTLAVAQATRRAGLRTLALAGAGAQEARLVDSLDVAVVEHLASAVRVLSGGAPDRPPAPSSTVCHSSAADEPQLDLADVRGQHHAVNAIVIAAAGGPQCLVYGPPRPRTQRVAPGR